MSMDTIAQLHADISVHLNAINHLFTGFIRITLLVRTPDLEDGGVLLTNEKDLEQAIAEIQRLQDKQARFVMAMREVEEKAQP